MEEKLIEVLKTPSKDFWDGYNNVGIGVVAITSVLNHAQKLSLPKALLIIPMIMHRSTLLHFSHKSSVKRGSAALASSFPELFANFNERFENSLPLSMNSIQLLVHLEYGIFGQLLVHRKHLNIGDEFGLRAQKIAQASEKISELFSESDEELYLNFKVQL